MNRRTFIQSLSLAGLAVGAGSLSPRLLARARGANDRIRVGLVGFADRSRDTLIPAFQRLAGELNCEIVAVSDIWNRRRDEAVAFFKTKYSQDIAVYRNNEEMYEKAGLDAVIIATADFQHALHCIEAVNAGCDAYVEKPFAETMADNRAALKAVRASKQIVQIGSQRRSGRSYHAAHDYIKSGQFGDIVFAEMSWNVNQPGRWRRPDLVAGLKEGDVDWKRFLMNRPRVAWDPRKYVEYRLFWPYSSGIPGQWMCHQIDTVHWFTGLPHPRSVSANGGIYMWKDGRTNFDTMTSVFDYGPLDDPTRGFQVVYTSRFSNSAGGVKEIYYSNGGELNLDTNEVSPKGGLTEKYATRMKMRPNRLKPASLKGDGPAATDANTGVDNMVLAHMRNWMECLRSRKEPNAPVEAGYQHSIATIMANAAARTGEKVTFDAARQEVLAGGKVFHL
ncbi:putative dehydrogenase [Ereboglobus sp. PH5-10]|uniref:Gfo/Idh/MocA family protein n=1 Tax=Ereboglobus sp. PH5-10 TaxID=2940629 RepID=UPI0024054DA7|nr:Gfo/Idh/MocA family oxidoreductase [Ereboglobus sp. PH5-10]MDF9827434.1 putative dehydrogenase [Ereboglobus sp. PH5-10]